MIRPALLTLMLALPLTAAAQEKTTYRWVDERGQVHYSDLPPPSSVLKLEVQRYAAPPPDPTPSYTLRKLTADFPVTLYTSDNCGELCTAARTLLQRRGIPFTESSIATQADLASYRERFGTPETVPTLTVGTTPYKGFEAGAWNGLLDEVGYPKTPVPGR